MGSCQNIDNILCLGRSYIGVETISCTVNAKYRGTLLYSASLLLLASKRRTANLHNHEQFFGSQNLGFWSPVGLAFIIFVFQMFKF